MSANPRFSIIVPYYNRPSLIDSCLSSLSQQSFQDWEAIVVDDGSSEPIAEILGEKFDGRVRFLRNATNRGAGASRNVGLRQALGQYLLFLDSDDELCQGALNVLDTLCVNGRAGVLIGAWLDLSEDGGSRYFFPPRPYSDDAANCVACGWTTGSFAIHRDLCPVVSETRMPWEMAEVILDAVVAAKEDVHYTAEALVKLRQGAELSLTVACDHFEPRRAGEFWLEMRSRYSSNFERRTAFDKRIFDASLSLYWKGRKAEAMRLLGHIPSRDLSGYPWKGLMTPAWFVTVFGARLGLQLHSGLTSFKRLFIA